MTGISLMVGLRYWNILGDTIMIEMGSDHSVITDRAASPAGGFSLVANDRFKLSIASMSFTKGSRLPGFFTYHNNRKFTTTDSDNDSAGNNCAHNYNNAPWWYGGCWDGSFWGGCGNSHTMGPYWQGSGGDQRNFAAIWVGF